MTVSLRLKKIIEFTGKCGVVADIGTDHALVPVYLVENGLCERVYASDIRPLPLKRASEYVISRGLSDKITLILSDGLQNIPDDTDVVIIAGMGGEMISEIMSSDKSHKSAKYVLQPMTAVEDLRSYLYRNGFMILDEDIVCEHSNEKLYSVMIASYNFNGRDYYETNSLLSNALKNKSTPERDIYIRKLIKSRQKILHGLKSSKKPDEQLITKTIEELNYLEGCL